MSRFCCGCLSEKLTLLSNVPDKRSIFYDEISIFVDEEERMESIVGTPNFFF